MKVTPEYNLRKPEDNDNVLVEDLNFNMDTVEEQLKERDTRVGPLASLGTTIKTSIVNAINSLLAALESHKAENTIQGNPHGINAKAPIDSPIFTGIPNLGSTQINGGIRTFHKKLDNANGSGILASYLGDKPHCGMLFVTDLGNYNYLIATFFKGGLAGSPVVKVIDSLGLTLGFVNASGTQAILGHSGAANIRMRAIHYEIY